MAAPPSIADSLPSWKEGDAKQHIVDFIRAITTEGGHQFVAAADRIATFDLDGTLWTERPIYAQAEFVIDLFTKRHGSVERLAPVASLLQRVRDGIADFHQSFATLRNLITVPINIDEYIVKVREWLDAARHPRFQRVYSALSYKPMRELLDCLRANDFRTYIVSGTGIEFIRAFSAEVFGIPPEQVIGSSLTSDFITDPDGSNATINLLPWPDFIDNGKRKAESINEFIGRRPIAAFGNSDGDQQMLEWTACGSGARLMGLVHHTDAIREYAYDLNAHIGHLDLALREARRHGWDDPKKRGWVIVDMAHDWNRIYSFET